MNAYHTMTIEVIVAPTPDRRPPAHELTKTAG
jgi:hypothetical protein